MQMVTAKKKNNGFSIVRVPTRTSQVINIGQSVCVRCNFVLVDLGRYLLKMYWKHINRICYHLIQFDRNGRPQRWQSALTRDISLPLMPLEP